MDGKGRMSVRRAAEKLLAYGVAPAGKLKRVGRDGPCAENGGDE
jgi:hypothetical protein